MTRIVFSDHALRKLRERRIAKEKVRVTIHSPDTTRNTRKKRKIAYKRFQKLYLKVVYIKEGNTITVVTQHWDESFNPNI